LTSATAAVPAHDVPEAPAEQECTNCGAPGARVYCRMCGEKQPHHHDLTVGHFFHDLFHELAHVDSKVFRTLRDLVVRPGELTVAYFAGRKTRYVAPLRLFLTLFALQFLAYTIYKPVAIYRIDSVFRLDRSHQFETMLKRNAVKHHMDYAEMVEKIDHQWQKNMSMLNLAAIAGLAVWLKVLYARRRRFLGEHLVFAAHYMAFSYVMALAIWPVNLAVGITLNRPHFVLVAVTSLLLCVYLYLAMRRYYQQGPGRSAVKAVLAFAGTYVVKFAIIACSLPGAVFLTLRG
jgi:hypothetical protein